MLRRHRAWSGALTVMLITGVLVILDLSDGPVHRYWAAHAFTASVLSGVLVLLLTVLIVDRVTRMRQVRGQSRAVAAQAAIIVAQANRTAQAVTRPSPSAEDRETAGDELRTYAQMLLTSAPVLIDAPLPRTFLESAQRLGGQLFRALEDGAEPRASVDQGLDQLRAAAGPLLSALDREQRAAVSSDTVDQPASASQHDSDRQS
ncbi:MAG TPA: hypothetical protein VFH80_08775 [Solirubrobacteraceae bacterium]|nr:hypothetical protein [Solirubrobacteraceae bacterium]